MEWAIKEENPDGIATNAVHAAIALGDAFTVSQIQRRSRGQDHHEVLLLIAQCRSPAAPEVGRFLQRILNRMEEVQYQSRDVQLDDAEELAKHARKLISIVRGGIS